MLDAIGLYHLRWRKKKVDFIIPPTYYRNNNFSITEVKIPETTTEVEVKPIKETSIVEKKSEVLEVETSSTKTTPEIVEEEKQVVSSNQQTTTDNPKVSALSLASIRAKRELEQQNKSIVKEAVHLPTEPFTETDMLLHWTKYAQRLGDKGYKIMESLLLLNDPKLEGSTIIHELPNEGSKIDFDSEKLELLGYLRGRLHNHDITIEVVVNETVENKFAFTAQDKYNRLNQLNPNLELLRKTFDLDL